MWFDYQHANSVHTNSSNNTLWLGDASVADDIHWIRENNVRTVISAVTGFNIKYDSSVRHIVVPINDHKSQNILQYFEECSHSIGKGTEIVITGLKFGSVLVHCGAGVSRSATLVIAYLMKFQEMSFSSALKFTKAKRKSVCPNLGFERQLKKYENHLRQNPMDYSKKKNYSFPMIRKSEKKKEELKGKISLANSRYQQSTFIIPQHQRQIKHKQSLHQYLKKIASNRFDLSLRE